IIGEGRERANLEERARSLGVGGRVRVLGAIPPDQLAGDYRAADGLGAASSREGRPNGLLEASGRGNPVAATPAGGTPEIVAAAEAGVLASERSERGIVDALRQLLRNYPDRQATRRYAERFGWEETTRGQLRLFEDVLRERRRA